MPSNAKKRKAARKKKGKKRNNTNPSTNNPQGNDVLKFQNEKGSDGGEGGSHVHNEHDDHPHPFNDGSEEVERRDPSTAQPHAIDVKSAEEVSSDVKIDGGKEDCVFLVERESSENKNVSVEHNETSKESYYENGNTGDASKDESLPEKNTKVENCNVFKEAIACHELVKSADSSPSKTILINENALVEETVNSVADPYVSSDKAVASVSKVENNDSGSVLLEKSVVHPVEVTNLAMKTNEDNINSLTNENVRKSSTKEPKQKEYDSKVLDLLSASPFAKFTNGTEHINSAADPYVSSDKAVASVPKVENSDNRSVLPEKLVVHPVKVTNLAMKTNEDNVYASANENVTKSGMKEPKPKEYDSEVLDSLSASPFTKFTNGTEHIKDSETAECSENQPAVVLAPSVVRKTSWLSCCGLFEVLSSSNR